MDKNQIESCVIWYNCAICSFSTVSPNSSVVKLKTWGIKAIDHEAFITHCIAHKHCIHILYNNTQNIT